MAHALLVASAECFAPTRVALKAVRVGAALVAGGAGLRAVSASEDVFENAFSKPSAFRNRLERFASRAVDLVSPVPPEILRARFHACAPAFGAIKSGAAFCSTAYLRNALRFFFVSRAGAVVAPIKTRQISYATRVAPVVASYVARREWINATTKPGTKTRTEKWENTHVWGASRVEAIVLRYGGFFTKIGQLMGTARQMMPEAYVSVFSRTMDANPPAPFAKVRGEINRSLEARCFTEDGVVSPYRDVFEATFSEFDETPAATASVAQVHFARLRSDGARVAVKVVVADKNAMLGDLACASATARVMSRLGLDSGVDFPTVFAAYLDVVEDEFDLNREAEKMREFGALFESRGLGDKIAVPEPRDALCGETVLVSTRAQGTKLLKTLNRARESGRRPKCPPAAAGVHAFNRSDPQCGGWDGVFHTMHLAWGAMLLRHGHFHCDPHPGNFILRADGKLAILDWGQTHSVAPPFRRTCAAWSCMAGEHLRRSRRRCASTARCGWSGPPPSALCFVFCLRHAQNAPRRGELA